VRLSGVGVHWYLVLVGVAACGRLGFDPRDDVSAPDAGAGVGPDNPGTAQVVYTATIAECLDPNQPDLDACGSTNGLGQLVVDGNDGSTDSPWQSFVRFELDATLDGMTVRGVKLVMTATDDDKAAGPDSGDIWQVAAFDRASLAGGPPARIGTSPLARSRGSVDPLDVVQWGLPVTLIAARTTIYLGVITDDDSGGVNYWNLEGREPPRLVIDVD